MKNCLYEDFVDGLLQLLLMAIPVFLGLFTQYRWDQFQSIPLTLTLAIISLFYSEYNLYKDKRYKKNKRIKCEFAFSLSLLSISLVWTLFNWHSDNTIDSYALQTVMYCFSTLPFLIETIFAFLLNDIKANFNIKFFKKVKKSNKQYSETKGNNAFAFKITMANVN